MPWKCQLSPAGPFKLGQQNTLSEWPHTIACSICVVTGDDLIFLIANSLACGLLFFVVISLKADMFQQRLFVS